MSRRMLARLGAPTTALFFPGGATGAECERGCAAQGRRLPTFPLAAPTRAGLVVRAPQRPETTFLGPDVPLEAAAVRACAGYLDACPRRRRAGGLRQRAGLETAALEPLRAAIGRWLARGPWSPTPTVRRSPG